MSSCFGNKIRVSLFGESHGKGIGIVIDGIGPGILFPAESVRGMMDRRKPGGPLVTKRTEGDAYEIISGVKDGYTTGSPMCVIIQNTDTRSNDYNETLSVPRPGHADYTGHVKYRGYNDLRGGGHFSGRLTAPLVFAGALFKSLLAEKGIVIVSHLLQVGDVEDEPLDELAYEPGTEQKILGNILPFLSSEQAGKAADLIQRVQQDRDSVGGVIETGIYGLPAGIGEPFFGSVESILAGLMFSIPGVKGVDFGKGFDLARMRGSGANDAFHMAGDEVRTSTNHMGGVLGGITNAMPVLFKVAAKPTSSIGKTQESVDLESRENTRLDVKGRHDPCIAVRMVPVVEAMAALGIYELMEEGKNG
ncbi:MAG: chorismate synthase [Clostridia bacterium]